MTTYRTAKALDPWIWQQEATPDGFAEVTIEIHGRILWTVVMAPGMDNCDCADWCHWLARQLQRFC